MLSRLRRIGRSSSVPSPYDVRESTRPDGYNNNYVKGCYTLPTTSEGSVLRDMHQTANTIHPPAAAKTYIL